MYSFELLRALFDQHGNKSHIFGEQWMTAVLGVVLDVSKYLDFIENTWNIVLSWLVAGLLIVVIILGGAIYHDYHTCWLLIGVFAGLALSVETVFQ